VSSRPLPDAVGDEEAASAPDDCIELRAPARPEMWSLVRMVASHAASLVNLDFEQLSDVRLAVDELATACSRGALPGCELQLVIRWEEGTLTVTCLASPVGADGGHDGELPLGFGPDELSERIIEALVDDYEISSLDGSTRRGWLRKSR